MTFIKDNLNKLFDSMFLELGLSVQNILFGIFLALFLIVFYNVINRILKNNKKVNNIPIDNNFKNIIINIIKALYIFFSIIIVASILGINTTSLIAAFSVIGIAVSLAIQNIMSNMAYSLSIMFSKPFKVGDYIKAGEQEGTVVNIGFMNTKIETLNNEVIFVPNNTIGSQIITNFSENKSRRIVHSISVSYEDDIDKVKKVLRDTISSNNKVIIERNIEIILASFEDSGIRFEVRFWTENAFYYEVKASTLEAIKKAFDENNITIPYPHTTVLQK